MSYRDRPEGVKPTPIYLKGFRCAGCGYDLSGTSLGSRCPECGRKVDDNIDKHTSFDEPRYSKRALSCGVASMCTIMLVIGPPILTAMAYWYHLQTMKDIQAAPSSKESEAMSQGGVALGVLALIIETGLIVWIAAEQL